MNVERIVLIVSVVVGIVLLLWTTTLAMSTPPPSSASSEDDAGAAVVRADSPARLYDVVGGRADIWWNNTKVTGPDTVNPQTARPFEIRHVRNITFKAIDVPLRVDVRTDVVTYSKLRIHRDLTDLHHVIHSQSKKAVKSFEIDEGVNYYTLETLSVVSK